MCVVVQMLLSIYMVSAVQGCVIGGAQEAGGRHSTLQRAANRVKMRYSLWNKCPEERRHVVILSHLFYSLATTPLWFIAETAKTVPTLNS
jgi:hypothetical protein